MNKESIESILMKWYSDIEFKWSEQAIEYLNKLDNRVVKIFCQDDFLYGWIVAEENNETSKIFTIERYDTIEAEININHREFILYANMNKESIECAFMQGYGDLEFEWSEKAIEYFKWE